MAAPAGRKRMCRSADVAPGSAVDMLYFSRLTLLPTLFLDLTLIRIVIHLPSAT